MSFGELLRDERSRRGLGLNQLADKLGCSSAYLSRVENGRIDCVPSEELLAKIAKELSLKHDEVCRLAGRIPADIERYILDHPGVLKRLRRERTKRIGQ